MMFPPSIFGRLGHALAGGAALITNLSPRRVTGGESGDNRSQRSILPGQFAIFG